MTNAADKNYRENQNTHFKFIFPPQKNVQFVWGEKCGRGRQVSNDNTILCRKDVIYMLNSHGKKEYRHTVMIFN